MDLQHYFIWSSVALITFYVFYLLLLKKETFFVLNRLYLLATLGLSMLIPFLDLSGWVKIPSIELAISPFSLGANNITTVVQKELDWLTIVYWVGVGLSATLLLIKLVGVNKQIKLRTAGNAFSFWKTKVIDQKLPSLEVIEAHENVHVKQLHTLDILFIELISVFFWFNPVIYFYRRSLKLIHEYLADAHAANFTGSKKQYAMVLFLQQFKTGPALTHTFYHVSLLEARIKMLQRKKSNSFNLWKYMAGVPLFVLLLVLSSFQSSTFKDNQKLDQPASFPGGFENFGRYIIETGRKVSKKNGTVNLSFVVETNGQLTNEKIEKSLDAASDEEAIRLIKTSPKWNPALQNGEKVRSAYRLSVNFKADNQIVN